MTNPDFIHSTHQIAYERRSAAEEALTRALPLDAAVQMLATSDRPSYVLIKSGASRSAWHGICHQRALLPSGPLGKDPRRLGSCSP